MLTSILPFVLCAIVGLLLAIVELIQTFGRWIGPYWRSRSVVGVMLLNMATACGVYAFIRYALEVENGLWLAVITGLTFPAILRSRFTFYQPLGKGDGVDAEGFSLTIDSWYRNLQNSCYEEVNSQIAAKRAQTMSRLRHCLKQKEMSEQLSDHIAAEVMSEQRKVHQEQLDEILALAKPADRERRLAALMLEIMPETVIKRLLRSCPK